MLALNKSNKKMKAIDHINVKFFAKHTGNTRGNDVPFIMNRH